MGLNFQRATRQYIETEILLVNDRMVVDIPGEEVEGGQAWQELVKTLRVLGFDLSKKDGWELLGLPKFDGPDPDKATVLRRAGLVDDLLDKANDTVLEPEEQAKRAEWVCRLAEARSQCVGELGEVRRIRGQIKVANAAGEFSLAVDLTDLPSPTGSFAAQVGQTVFFQAWYRAGGVSSPPNFTDAVALTFR